jgi:DNA replication protein DnaC
MNWDDFITINSIAKTYHKVAIDKLNIYNTSCTDFQLSAIEFMSKPKSLILQGDPGRGKTFFMLTLIKELFKTKNRPLHEVRFINASDLDEKVSDEIKKFNTASYYLNTLIDVPFLFLDDFGVEGSREKAERNYYTILDKRLANYRPTVISTNLTDTEILKTFGSRIDSRLKQCVKLVFENEDLRKPDD